MKKKSSKRNPKAEPVTVDVNRLRISFSGADTYLSCGKQYEFRYVQDIKSPPAVALIEGSSHHKSMEMNNLNKRDKGFDLAHGTLTDIFMDDFRDRVKNEGEVIWEGETENNIFSRARVLHERYINDLAPKIKPVEIEKKFELPVDLAFERGDEKVKIMLTGIMDLEQESNILDYKTAARSKGQSEVDNSLQLSLYSYASKKDDVGIIEFLKKANPEVGLIMSRRNSMQKIWALKVVRSVALAIQNGVYPLAPPNSWRCSERFCGYWHMCRGNN